MKEDVRYLAFEGGGGKGVSYIGALEALEELGILTYFEKHIEGKSVTRLNPEKIKGVSGTSVGSVVALLLACGFKAEEMEELLLDKVGKTILDTVRFGEMPTIFSNEYQDIVVKDPRFDNAEKFMKASWSNFLKSDDKKISDFLNIPANQFQRGGIQFLSLLMKGFLNHESRQSVKKKIPESETRRVIWELAQSDTINPALKKILDEPVHAFNCLKYEYGLFLGSKARELFDSWIEQKSGIKNCTFANFVEEFNIDLVITAVSTNSKEVLYFRNNEKWKNLCVADAVRMSIGIPFVFKPVLLKRTENGIASVINDFKHVDFMTDGGSINNLPIHVFDEEDSLTLNPSILGFSLVDFAFTEKIEVDSFSEYFLCMSRILVKNATNLQIYHKHDYDQIIKLDTKDVSVFDFSFDELPVDMKNESREKTLQYFS